MNEHEPSKGLEAGVRPRAVVTGADWGLVAIGVGLSAFGVYWTIANHSKLIGPAMIAGGLTIVPVRLVAMIGGAGLVAVGAGEIWRMHAASPLGVLLILMGLVSIVERLRRAQ